MFTSECYKKNIFFSLIFFFCQILQLWSLEEVRLIAVNPTDGQVIKLCQKMSSFVKFNRLKGAVLMIDSISFQDNSDDLLIPPTAYVFAKVSEQVCNAFVRIIPQWPFITNKELYLDLTKGIIVEKPVDSTALDRANEFIIFLSDLDGDFIYPECKMKLLFFNKGFFQIKKIFYSCINQVPAFFEKDSFEELLEDLLCKKKCLDYLQEALRKGFTDLTYSKLLLEDYAQQLFTRKNMWLFFKLCSKLKSLSETSIVKSEDLVSTIKCFSVTLGSIIVFCKLLQNFCHTSLCSLDTFKNPWDKEMLWC